MHFEVQMKAKDNRLQWKEHMKVSTSMITDATTKSNKKEQNLINLLYHHNKNLCFATFLVHGL